MLDTQKEREKKRRSKSEIKTAGSFFTSRDGGFDIIVVVRAAKKRVRATSDDGPQRTKREEAKISTPPKTLFLSRDRVGDDVFHEDGREGFLRNENHRKKNTLFVLPRERVFTNLAREEREREREREQKPTDGHGIPARSTHSSPEKRA